MHKQASLFSVCPLRPVEEAAAAAQGYVRDHPTIYPSREGLGFI